MTTQYFVDAAGNYLGAFEGAGALAKLPPDAVEVPAPPEHGHQKWNAGMEQWGAVPTFTDADRAEELARGNPALLALGRIVTNNNALSEDDLVAALRAKLP